MTMIKAQKAYNLHRKGEYEAARKLYEEALGEGMNQARYLMAYSTLLLRSGEYQKARELLVKTQKAPDLMPDQKVQLFCSYAAAVFRLGEVDKGIAILEKQHLHNVSGLVYQTLGYLYVEKYDAANKPDFDRMEAEQAAAEAAKAAAQAAEMTDEGAETEAEAAEQPAAPEEDKESPREAWQKGVEKARKFIDESVEYDDEDSICLDNKAQFLYRVLGDKAAAKPVFDKAIALKPGQIDTLWFLSRYDLEAGKTQDAKAKLEKALEGRFSPLNYASRDTVQAELDRLK